MVVELFVGLISICPFYIFLTTGTCLALLK